MTRPLTLLGLLAAALVLPAAAAPAKTPDLVVEVNLAPKKVHEECARLEAGEARRWHWKSSTPVDFNIHYHRGEEVFYPVKRDGMRGDGGTFTAKTGEDYCWMWTARNAPTKVDGRIEKK
jgi:hypothetical protein